MKNRTVLIHSNSVDRARLKTIWFVCVLLLPLYRWYYFVKL